MEDKTDKKQLVLIITEALIQSAIATKKTKNRHYYVHNDGIHRIIWSTPCKIEQMLGQFCLIDIKPNCYPGKQTTMDSYAKKKHLLVIIKKQAIKSEQDHRLISLSRIIQQAPRDHVTGRRPLTNQNTVTIKAQVTEEAAEFLRRIGKGNLSEGVRRSVRLAREETERQGISTII